MSVDEIKTSYDKVSSVTVTLTWQELDLLKRVVGFGEFGSEDIETAMSMYRAIKDL